MYTDRYNFLYKLDLVANGILNDVEEADDFSLMVINIFNQATIQNRVIYLKNGMLYLGGTIDYLRFDWDVIEVRFKYRLKDTIVRVVRTHMDLCMLQSTHRVDRKLII